MQIHRDRKSILGYQGLEEEGGEMRNYCLTVTEFLFGGDGKVLEVDSDDVLCVCSTFQMYLMSLTVHLKMVKMENSMYVTYILPQYKNEN